MIREVLTEVAPGRLDVVLLDLNLPRRDGREVLAGVDPGLAWSLSWSRRSFS
jgi:DNA-binding response OmpR family regulator